jgi:hypothetical protein
MVWITSAKKEETGNNRLSLLIGKLENGKNSHRNNIYADCFIL